jgi:hypothetical protein
MRKTVSLPFAVALPLIAATAVTIGSNSPPIQAGGDNEKTIQAAVVATGIPGAGAITQIGTFHKGGPFAGAFAPFTEAGRILDRTRLFVASSSNFGASLAHADQAPGSILSLDVSSGVVSVPAQFAAAVDPSAPITPTAPAASAVGGKVMLYTAQNAAFVNGRNNPAAVTADLTSVSLPLGISLNNGFGRPWFANAPLGATGFGTISIVDPSGIPLAGAPSARGGGVMAGDLTDHPLTPTGGLTTAAIATALATKSPELTIPQRAVFFAALADGSVDQVHVEKGVSPLVGSGAFTPIPVITTDAAESTDPTVATRAGMIFNWVPTRNLFVTDPLSNRILVLDISDEGTQPQPLFSASNLRYITSSRFDVPIDIAAAVPETASRNFASNTTLGGGSDIYVLNRGNNSIVRMTQTGNVVAEREILAPDAPGFRANGLAVSDDARLIWVTATMPNHGGVVLQMPAFGAGPVTTSLLGHAGSASGAIAQGAAFFSLPFSPDEALGPLFNGRSCNSCHTGGGMGTTTDSFVRRVANVDNGIFDPLIGHGGPIARQHSVDELGLGCGLPTGDPPQSNTFTSRSAMTLRGTSLIENIRPGDMAIVQAAQPASVRGRLNILADGRVGKFGWKAQTATLVEFMGEALRDEMGVTNPLASIDLVRGCRASVLKPEADATSLTSLVAHLNTLDPPTPTTACLASPGAAVFNTTGCATCHTPSIPGPGNATAVRLYSDMLLHDMGPGLADGFQQGSARGNEFRTAPLWRVADRVRFLHDGRARTIQEAIDAHGGQATAAKSAFNALSGLDIQALLSFLGCI